jgi:hypothetical protein
MDLHQIDPDLNAWARQVIEAIVSEASSRAPFVNDLASLAQMPNRPGAARCA